MLIKPRAGGVLVYCWLTLLQPSRKNVITQIFVSVKMSTLTHLEIPYDTLLATLYKYFWWFWKLFLAILRNRTVINISHFLTILWFIPCANWVPNVLTLRSSRFSLSDLFYEHYPRREFAQLGTKWCSRQPDANIVCIIEINGNWTILIFADIWYVIKHIFCLQTYLHMFISTGITFNNYMVIFEKPFYPTNVGKSRLSLLKSYFSS